MPEINRYFVHLRSTVPKPDVSVRPVGNYSVVNEFIRCDKFKMESLKTICEKVHEGDWLYFLHLEKCYTQTPMSPKSVPFSALWFGDKLYGTACGGFGISIVPRVCTKLMKPVLAHVCGPPRYSQNALHLDEQGCHRSAMRALSDGAKIRHVFEVTG